MPRNGFILTVVALTFGPVLAFLALARWGAALLYAALMALAFASGYALASLGLSESAADLARTLASAVFLAGAVHAIRAVRTGHFADRTPWYARWPAAIALAIGLPLIAWFGTTTTAFRLVHVETASMLPNLDMADHVLVNAHAYGINARTSALRWPRLRLWPATPARGDVIAFLLPYDESATYVRRVVGVPGDTIEMRGGALHIGGDRVTLSDGESIGSGRAGQGILRLTETLPNGARYAILDSMRGGRLDDTPPVRVPAGHVFVLGDHRDGSTDSRASVFVGAVPIDLVIGRVERVVWNERAQTLLWRAVAPKGAVER